MVRKLSLKVRKLALVRHGQSQYNLENKFAGWTDVDLTETGQKEAIQVREARADQFDNTSGMQFAASTCQWYSGWRASPHGRFRVRLRLYLGVEAMHKNLAADTRGNRPVVDPGSKGLATERAALRRPTGQKQSPDSSTVWRRAAPRLATWL